jgi:hypothetical protein
MSPHKLEGVCLKAVILKHFYLRAILILRWEDKIGLF